MSTVKIRNHFLLFGCVVLVAACGDGLIRGQPPLVGLSVLQLDAREIQARVDVHNPNGVEMNVSRFEMTMTLGNASLGQHIEPLSISIHPNGTEEIRFGFPSDETARRLLADLEQGQRNSLPYTVSGRVLNPGGGSENFSQQGYLYPVPGRPGQFRGAGSQRERPRER